MHKCFRMNRLQVGSQSCPTLVLFTHSPARYFKICPHVSTWPTAALLSSTKRFRGIHCKLCNAPNVHLLRSNYLSLCLPRSLQKRKRICTVLSSLCNFVSHWNHLEPRWATPSVFLSLLLNVPIAKTQRKPHFSLRRQSLLNPATSSNHSLHHQISLKNSFMISLSKFMTLSTWSEYHLHNLNKNGKKFSKAIMGLPTYHSHVSWQMLVSSASMIWFLTVPLALSLASFLHIPMGFMYSKFTSPLWFF